MTEAEFVDTVAENIGIAAAGQSLDADSAAIIRRRMAAVFARLAREELTTVANTDDIPDAQALALADIVARNPRARGVGVGVELFDGRNRIGLWTILTTPLHALVFHRLHPFIGH